MGAVFALGAALLGLCIEMLQHYNEQLFFLGVVGGGRSARLHLQASSANKYDCAEFIMRHAACPPACSMTFPSEQSR
jgi:hypothetical protein